MPLNIPSADNPWGVGIRQNDTTKIGLYEAPKSRWHRGNMVAEGINAAVDSMNKVTATMEKWQEEVDKTNAQDAMNRFDAYLADRKSNAEYGWQNLKGKNALEFEDGRSLQQRELEDFDEQIKQYNEKLSPRARKMFNERYGNVARLKLSNDLSNHTVAQQKQWEADVDNESFKRAQEMIASGDPEQMAAGVSLSHDLLQKQADRTGSIIDASKFMGGSHAGAINNFVDAGNSAAAAQWLKDHREEMTPAQIKTAEKSIEAGKLDEKAEAAAAKVLAAKDPEAALLAIRDKDTFAAVSKKVTPELKRREMIRKKEATSIFNVFVRTKHITPSAKARLCQLDPGMAARVEAAQDRMAAEAANAQLRRILGQRGNSFAERVQAAIDKDPAQVAINTGRPGFAPIQNLSDPSAVAKTLNDRNSAWNDKELGTNRRPFTSGELTAMLSGFEKLLPEDQAGHWMQIMSGLDPDTRRAALLQIRSADKDLFRALSSGSAETAAALIAGQAYQKQKTAKPDQRAVAEAAAPFVRNPVSGVRGVFRTQEAENDFMASLRDASAYLARNGGKADAAAALDLVVGGGVAAKTAGGDTIIAPRGISTSSWNLFGRSLRDAIQDCTRQITEDKDTAYYRKGKRISADELADLLESSEAQLVNVNGDNDTPNQKEFYVGAGGLSIMARKKGEKQATPLRIILKGSN